MKEQEVVKHIGLSSHTPATIHRVMDDVSVDMLMFSVNPGYDYQKGEYAKGSVDERSSIYSRCEKEGIGISVMKPFSGGQMLDAEEAERDYSVIGSFSPADACVQCGHCEARCPFHVKQESRMKEIADYFQ